MSYTKNITNYTAITLTVLSLTSVPMSVIAQSVTQAQKNTQRCLQSRQACSHACNNKSTLRDCILICTEIETQCIKKVINSLPNK